jgi:starch phosphorylase
MTPWRELPPALTALHDLALDLRWTWSHEADALWQRIDAELWRRTHSPWTIVEDIPAARLAELAADRSFVEHLDRLAAARRGYLEGSGWFAQTGDAARLAGVAFFSMEFGFGDALPLYAGGLGVLAGDLLKAASDVGVPIIGVGLLYQEGYFRQMIDASGWQQEAYPYNDPSTMPIEPVIGGQGAMLHIPVELPGRTLLLRVWRAPVGRTVLYLLDSNDPLNSPVDRGITGKLYGGGSEMRLMQEIVLGIGGWRVVEALHPDLEVCHLNEGHAAFAVVERARQAARRHGLSFAEALWATRAGNVFTSHTPVDAGFDRFAPELLARYGDALDDVLPLGRENADGADAPFNMAHLAAHGALLNFGVSRLHGVVSRRIFQPLYSRWPEAEVPFGHVTNGVHVPSWDSRAADELWTEACGKDRWRRMPEDLSRYVETISDAALWALRGQARQELVGNVRSRLRQHLGGRGQPPEVVALAGTVLDPNVLTLGFARRFTEYKRPDLLLRDRDRLGRLLRDEHRPAQLVIAGKAHPADELGKRMIQEWIAFAQHPAFRRRVVFLEDYDISLAQELVQGVDVWINTPCRPWEACGTSGMKVLVNGGLNLSTLDGWWEEAYAPDLGWAIGDERQGDLADQDRGDAAALYALLEREVVPAFYDRDTAGVPRAWVARMRRSMAVLTQHYSAARMVREYIEKAYLPAAAALRQRLADGAAAAKAMASWEQRVRRAWPSVHVGPPDIVCEADGWAVAVPVYLGEMAADDVRVEAYADAAVGSTAARVALSRDTPIAGATNGFRYLGKVPGERPIDDYTVRVVPHHAGVRIPAELALIRWQK